MSKILLIDDEIEPRELIKDYLEGSGFEIVEAGTGREGLEILKSDGNSITAVLTDIIMPDMNGLDMIKELRRFNRGMKVLAMSGYEDELAQAKRAGAAATFQKPLNMEEIKNFLELITERESA